MYTDFLFTIIDHSLIKSDLLVLLLIFIFSHFSGASEICPVRLIDLSVLSISLKKTDNIDATIMEIAHHKG
ncbi:hypothetical protein Gain_0063_033 [Komagataeibacter intermedius TF2]|nr:hypothetical protein Gain_0063_033 [Komagataeibacter intermedius TF2]